MSAIARTSAGVSRWGDVCGTGRPIVKRTRVLQPSPGMESTRRPSQEPQERPHGTHSRARYHGSQDPDLGAFVGQPLVRQCEPRASKQGQREPK
jgi:hypothetical protein